MTTCSLPFTTVGIELNRLFTGDYEFHIPEYQRPYEWTTDNALQLVQDVWEASTRNANDYFLGSIVLASKEKSESFAVYIIDGQQRITTIILLLSLLRSMHTEDKFTRDITDRLTQREDVLTSRGERHRFFPSRNISSEFVEYFLDSDNAHKLVNLLESSIKSPENFELEDPIQRMMKNLFVIHEYFEKTITRQKIGQFVQYMLMKVNVVVIQIQDEKSAFRIFSTLNNRGRQLSVIDNLKYSLLTRAVQSGRENVAAGFNDLSQMLSEGQFISLITKILPICFEVDSIVENIDKILDENNVTADDFVTKLLGPYTMAFRHILLTRGDIEPLLWLRQFNRTHPTWIALGVEYFRQYESSNTTELHKAFFKKLELVMVYFLLSRPYCLSKEITDYIKKWVQKLRRSMHTVDPSGDHMDFSYSIDHITFQPPSDIPRSKFRDAIDLCDVYNFSDIRKFVLAKINWKLADPHINVLCPEVDITIEHICPQSAAQAKRESPWRNGSESWHHAVIKKYINKVGNLVLLSRPSNSSVREKPYDQKYPRLQNSSFAITQHLCRTYPTSFSSQDVKERHTFLVDTFVGIYYD